MRSRENKLKSSQAIPHIQKKKKNKRKRYVKNTISYIAPLVIAALHKN